MKAKLLLSSWLQFALAALIAIQAAFLWWCMTYIVPTYQRFRYDGWFEGDENSRGVMSWTHGIVSDIVGLLDGVSASWWLWGILLVAAPGFVLWRIRSEHRPMIGFSTLATAALGVVALTTALSMAVLISLVVGVRAIYTESPEQTVKQQLQYIDLSVEALERAVAKGDWAAMQTPAQLAAHGIGDLATMGAAAPAMLSLDRQQKIDRLRDSLKIAEDRLRDVQSAIQSKDSPALQAALERFRSEYPPMR